MLPAISLVAFEDRTPHFIFVKVPNERGRYVRTDYSVALVPCCYCKALVGEPCFRLSVGGKRYFGGTHFARRIRAKSVFRPGKTRPDDIAGEDSREEP